MAQINHKLDVITALLSVCVAVSGLLMIVRCLQARGGGGAGHPALGVELSTSSYDHLGGRSSVV